MTEPVVHDPIPTDTDGRLALFIGPKYASVYRRKFQAFADDPRFVPTWNWSAAVAAPFWFIYRKMYLWFAVFFFVPSVVLQWLVPTVTAVTPESLMAPENRQALLMILAVQVSTRIAAGGVANWLLYRRARTAVRVLGAPQLPAEHARALVQRVGGTNRVGTLVLVVLFFVMGIAQVLGTAAGR